MGSIPSSDVGVDDTAGAVAAGLDTICIMSPCLASADTVPRLFGTAAAAFEQHGYCEGVEYASLHVDRTGQNFLFVGLPIATAGAVGRFDSSGNSGTSVVSVAAASGGVLGEHEGVITVDQGGTVGTDQIVLRISLDGGRSDKPVRVGTANSYTIPHVGAVVSLGAGTLVAGDTVLTWFGSAPRSDATGWAAAFTALGEQQEAFRTIILCGAVQDSTEANAFTAYVNAYATTYKRFVAARVEVPDRLPLAALGQITAHTTGDPSLTFLEVGGTGDTVTRGAGSWITDGFVVGDFATFSGTVSNNVSGPIASLSATVLTFGTTDLANEGPLAGVTVTASPGLTFAASGHTITRSRGSWLADGFRAGDSVTIAGTASNNATSTITALSATVMTFASGVTDEVVKSSAVTITGGQTKAAWGAATASAFASVDGFRIWLGWGRGRVLNTFSRWNFRRSASWAASLREYQHDLHIAPWRKSDGPTGFDLYDAGGKLVEWDDRLDGGTASASRFTSFMSYANGRKAAYIAQSLTRGDDASLLVHSHNVAVVNLAETLIQAETETAAIGASLELNADGTATAASLANLETQINAPLENALLRNVKAEGARASKILWTASKDDILNVPDATLTWTADLNLRGTIHKIVGKIVLRSGGQ